MSYYVKEQVEMQVEAFMKNSIWNLNSGPCVNGGSLCN